LKIKHDSLLTRQICDVIDGSAMTSRNLDRELAKCRKRSTHLLLDIKKCGLTFPRRFLLLLGKVLTRRGYHNYFSEYENCFLIDGNKTYRTLGGFFLGWSNEAPTILQCLILRLVRKTYKRLTAVVYNDDSDWVLTGISEEEQLVARAMIRSYYGFSGLLLSDKKEMMSRASVFCEIYNGFSENFLGDPSKRQIATHLLAKCLTTTSATMKLMYYQNALPWYNSDLEDVFANTQDAIISIGAVRPEAAGVPTLWGGMTLKIENGLNRAYEMWQYMTPKQRAYAVMMAELSKRISRRKLYCLRAANDRKRYEKAITSFANKSFVRCTKCDEEAELIRRDNFETNYAFLRHYERIEEFVDLELLTSSRLRQAQEIFLRLRDQVRNIEFRPENWDPG
jgi:hypothetical protein